MQRWIIAILVAITVCAVAARSGSTKQIVRPPGTKPDGNYSPGILVQDTLYICGQAGEDASGKVPDEFEAEVRQALENIRVVLSAAEMTSSDVVSVQVYLTDGALFPRMNAVYRDFFKDPRPTRTTVVVAKLVGPGHIEITATARKQVLSMSQEATQSVPLEAKSPYELRVNLSKDVPENVVKHSLQTGDIGFMHSFTTGSAVDGPGMRVVAWLAGCHWRCKFCHNPDTWSLTNGMPVPIEKAISELSKYRRGLNVMSGGLTITGGEPLLQDRFCVRLFAGAKKQGIHTVLNCNGALHARLSDAEFNEIDLVIMDLKTWGNDRHVALTAKEIGPTLECAKRLAALKKPMWLRTVVIPGWTDDPEIIEGIATFAAGLGNVERIDVLPFHQMGRYKWHKLGLEYAMENVQPPTNELVTRVCEQFRSHKLNVV